MKMVGYHKGDAMALPFDAGRFDAAVMALAITFVPDTAKGVQEMASSRPTPGTWSMADSRSI